jgi:hypothetical protein
MERPATWRLLVLLCCLARRRAASNFRSCMAQAVQQGLSPLCRRCGRNTSPEHTSVSRRRLR